MDKYRYDTLSGRYKGVAVYVYACWWKSSLKLHFDRLNMKLNHLPRPEIQLVQHAVA